MHHCLVCSQNDLFETSRKAEIENVAIRAFYCSVISHVIVRKKCLIITIIINALHYSSNICCNYSTSSNVVFAAESAK